MTDDGDVIGAIDRSEDIPQFVIADAEDDDAWISIHEEEALPIDVWR